MTAKSYFNIFCGGGKNESGFLILRTLKSAVDYKDKFMKWTDFLYADTNLGKLKVTLIIIS